MISKTKKLMSILLSIVMMLSVTSALGFNAFAYAYDDEAVRGLFEARYSKYQVFDVQRSPIYPGGTQANPSEFTVKSFRTPYGMPTTETDDGWFYFKGVGSAAESGVSYGALWGCADEGLDPYIVELWYNDNHGTDVKCSTGVIGGIGTEGFFYEGDSHWGYYFSNNQAYEYNSSLSVTYTPVQNGRVVVSREVLNNYEAGSMLFPDGYYNVTLDPGEGSGTAYTYGAKSVTFANPDAFTAPAGKVFDYWENNTNKYYVGDKMNLSNDATFVAHWVNGVTVTFDSNGGTPVSSQTIKPNTTVNAKETRTIKDGFKLKTWQLNGVDFDLSTPVTENITLTAVWEKSNAVFELDAEFGDIPSGWTIESSNSDLKWTVGVGDYSESTGTHSGDYNFKCTHLDRGEYAYLVSPTLDLSLEEATLEFWFINRNWGGDIDIFDVCYRVSNGEWVSIFSTNGNSNDVWTAESINLPEEALVPDVQIGFKMTDSYGYGVGLDDITLTAVPSAPSIKPDGFNLSIEDMIHMNLYINVDDYTDPETATVEVTYNDPEAQTPTLKVDTYSGEELAALKDADDGRYVIPVLAAPAQIRDNVSVTVTDRDDSITTSVAEYCETIIAQSEDDELVALAKAMLDYGKAASTEFDYNVDGFEEQDYYNTDDVSSAIDSASVFEVTNTGAYNFTGYTYIAKSVPAFRVYVNATEADCLDGEEVIQYATVDGERVAPTVVEETDKVCIDITGILAEDLDAEHTISFGGSTITINPLQYAKAKGGVFGRSMYNYHAAANSYFKS